MGTSEPVSFREKGERVRTSRRENGMSNLEITDSRAFVGINRLHVCEPDNRQTTVKAEEIMYHGRIQRKCVQRLM